MEIECVFEFHGPFYCCFVRSSSITKPGTIVSSFKGTHLEGKSNDDVDYIIFRDTIVEYFPLGLYKIFPNLRRLVVDHCGLKEISRRDLIGLENLVFMILRLNKLQSLPDNLLYRMTNLQGIDLSKNRLESLSSNLLRPVMNNRLLLISFAGNSRTLNCFFAPHLPGSVRSFKELCEIIDANCKKPTEPVVEDYPERISRGFKELWTSGRLSDFVVACGSKEFKVHKIVLTFHSPVLTAAVESGMQESKTGRMVIKDFSKEAVEDFLKYLYTGETPEDTNAMEICALASKYDVPELKKLMEEIIQAKVDETNALDILTLANQHSCKLMSKFAFAVIRGMFPGVELNSNLIDNLPLLKELIDAKHQHEHAKRHFEEKLKLCSANLQQYFENFDVSPMTNYSVDSQEEPRPTIPTYAFSPF